MSTRYVWGKYNIKGKWEGPFLTKWYHIPLYPPAGSSAQWNAGYFSTGILANSEFGSGGKGTLGSEFLSVAVAQKSGQYTNRVRTVYAPYSTEIETYATCIDGVKNSDDYVWYIGPDATGSGWALTCLDAATMKTYYDIKYYNRVEIAGTFIENVSDSSNSKYPTNAGGGVSSSYWYTYLGSDSIDPTSVTYSASGSKPGDKITVSVTPGSNKYGGTISYLYQYSTNGGSTWSTIETTTATSVSFTIPANANTIQFRARAQDDMGFVSSTYVTSASATVERLNAWVGVSGKARKGVELYVGVNGKARKVTGAWIGVNGKAKRFL